MTNWILHFPLVLFSRLCPADNPSHGTEESLLSKLRPFPNHWHGQTWTALGHQRCVGDSGFPRITWCQHRHKVQDETSTQLHLWEAFSIKKRYFRVSAWQGQVENLNKFWDWRDCPSQVFHYLWKQLGSIWKTATYLLKSNTNTQKRKSICKVGINIKSRCLSNHCCWIKTLFLSETICLIISNETCAFWWANPNTFIK